MPKMNRLAVLGAVCGLAILAISLPLASAANKKAERFLEQGRMAETNREYDKALELFEKAVAADPRDSAYLLALRRVRFAAGQSHVDAGQKLRREGKLTEALAEFQRAFAIDPASAIAEQEMRRTNAMIEREKAKEENPKSPASAAAEAGATPSDVARRDAEQRASRIMAVPELKPISQEILGLKMANQGVKVLYETLGKVAGINVLFDSEFQDQQKKFSVDLSNTTLDQALDYLALLTKTFVKPLSPNTIFVTQDNVTKRRDYEEQVTRIFYLQNLTSPQELQEVMTGMRTVTDIRKVFPVNSQSAIVVRGTADQVALAEKVLLDLDKAKPEVVVDVIVMEANKDKTRDLAITPVSGGKNGFSSSITFTPGGSSDSSAVSLRSLSSLGSGDWSATVPGALVQALMKDSSSRVLTSPQVRATDGQKASLRLGDRYPYATGSFQSGVGSVGVSPLVSTQFQFAEVGVNLDLTPRIHSNDEVSMQVEFEISNIRDKVDVGGLTQPVIGQRKVSHIIRVREGEVTLIGGLMQATQTKVRSGVPGLMQIPILGRFFSSDSIENINSDLLVALVPHIVRGPEVTAENVRSIATGTESIYKLNYVPRKEEPKKVTPGAAKPPAAPAGPAGLPMMQTPKPQAPAAPGTETPRSAVENQPVPAIQTNPGVSPDNPGLGRPTAGPGTPALMLKPSASNVNAAENFTVTLQVDNVTDLFTAPMRVKYDNKVVKLVEVNKGDFMGGDGQQVTFSESKVDAQGLAIINMNRLPGAGGISGSGTLLTLKFTAVASGSTEISLTDLTMRDARLQSISVTPPVTTVTVK
ncbi:cohesin domain-containing protein [uncultured Paludibaculum sp.]|uniref:cohesin domain-containing protein n=1 Tax=uncultured Paludibaculum sp. TaxID=1765020 RepID=UPI00374D0BF4